MLSPLSYQFGFSLFHFSEARTSPPSPPLPFYLFLPKVVALLLSILIEKRETSECEKDRNKKNQQLLRTCDTLHQVVRHTVRIRVCMQKHRLIYSVEE